MCQEGGRTGGNVKWCCLCCYGDGGRVRQWVLGEVRLGLVWFGLVRFGLVWFGLVWFDLV